MKFQIAFLHPKYLPTWILLFILFAISLLPTFARHKIAKLLSRIVYKKNHKRRHIIKTNLKHCFPNFSDEKINKLTRENIYFLALGAVEYSVILFASKRRLKNLVAVDNINYLKNLQQQNKGILLLLAHSPLLEFFAPALDGFIDGDYYKKPHNLLMHYFILKSRLQFVKNLITREDGIGKIIKPLKNHKIFYYPADEDLGEQYSTFAPFFNAQKSTLTTVSRISKATNCLAMPAIIVWNEAIKKYTVKFGTVFENYPSGDFQSDATQLNQQLELLILPNLTQYMWSFKLFRTRQKGDKSLY